MLRDDSSQPLKLYYRIGEVAEIVGVEPHVLRYWEKEFSSIRPQKSRSGQRVYSRKDVDKLIKVRNLLYTQGFTIAGAKKKLQQGGQEPRIADEGAIVAIRNVRESLLHLREEVVSSMQRLSRATEDSQSAIPHEIDTSDDELGTWTP